MIKNERQYRITKTQVDTFTESLSSLYERSKKLTTSPGLLKIQKDAIESQITDLKRQLQEYDDLKTGKLPIFDLLLIEDLPTTLIKARIALGLSQKDLAKRIGLPEQQIQRYEATDYESASVSRVKEIIKALNSASGELKIPDGNIPSDELFKKMSDVGLDRKFVLKRLLPSSMTTRLENRIVPNLLGFQAASQVGRIFGWNRDQIFSKEPLILNTTSISSVRFKVPKKTNLAKLNVYTVYAHYLAMLIIQATQNLSTRPIPKDPYEIHRSIKKLYGSITFENLVRYSWNQGIPVIALDDPGAFHGACFNENGRHVIILKQRTSSISRWMFDILHELWHVATNPSESTVHAISEPKIIDKHDSDEKIASQFAAAALLGKNPHDLIEQCLDEAKGEIRNLKEAIPIVAKRENVQISALANCVAFRVSKEGYDVWGMATNLQESQENPKKVIRNLLIENMDFSTMSSPDIELLRQALTYEEGNENE